MAQCQFPNVVPLYGVCEEAGHYAMVMEYLPKGSLYHVLHDSKEILPWNPVRWTIAEGVVKGLSYLHEQKIIHQDLKSLNVLLDAQYHAKITDFGLAKIKLESSSTSTKTKQGMGTTRWRAPELFKRGANPNFTSDMYSAGMVLWEIASRKLPFSDAADDATVISWIKEDGEQENIPSDCPKAYGELVQSCWNKEANQRPSAKAIAQQLNAIKPQTELPKYHAALRHFYGADENQCDQRIAGQAYTAKTLRYLLPMLENRARVILYVYEESKADINFKEALQGLSLLSKALGRVGVLMLIPSDSKKAARVFLIFGQQCIVVEASSNMKLTLTQEATLFELQEEKVLEKVIDAPSLLPTALDAKESAVVLVEWLSHWLKQPLLTLLEGLNQIISLPEGNSCCLEMLDVKSFQLIQRFSSTKSRRHHEDVLSSVPEEAVTSSPAISEEAFVQQCYEALPQRLLMLVKQVLITHELPIWGKHFLSNTDSFLVKSRTLRNLLCQEEKTPLVEGMKVLSKQLSETQSASLVSVSEIQLRAFLAEGAFGQVYEGFFAQTKVAIKVLKAGVNEVTQEEFKSEVGLMWQLNHPRIIRCYGLCLNPMQAVFELMKRGSLESQLREKRGENLVPKQPFLAQSIRQRMLLDIGEAIYYLHQNSIVHGDLRASNFLVNEQQEVKLGDFGLAKKRISNLTIEFANARYVTKLPWLAPELFSKGTISFASDVYSFGMVIWELMTGYEPFHAGKGLMVSQEKLHAVLQAGQALPYHALPSDTPDWIQAIFKACLSKEPSDRPTMGEIVQVLCCAVDHEKYQWGYHNKPSLESSSTWLQRTLSLLQTTSALSNPKIASPTTTTTTTNTTTTTTTIRIIPFNPAVDVSTAATPTQTSTVFSSVFHPGTHSKATDKNESVLSYPEQVEKISNEAKNKIDPNELSALFKWVTEGHLLEVEKLLKKNPTLALGTLTVKDLSDRTFNHITVLQHAAWCLDEEMSNLVMGYLGVITARFN